jgi:hypothetical protein
MQQNEIQQYFTNCPDLASLDDSSRNFLLSRGQAMQLNPKATLYTEGATLDDTFCLLLTGELLVEIGGKCVGRIPKNELFGEMAYFHKDKTRTATIRAGSMGAFVLRIRLTRAEMGAPGLTVLKSYLGTQAWDKFVSNSQRSV